MSDEIKNHLKARIRQKLNPFSGSARGFQRKVYLQERCSESEYLSMFPNARKFDKKTLPQCNPKFSRNVKMLEYLVNNPRELDRLFGEEWDIVHHGKSIGCALQVSLRFVVTTITSFQTTLNGEEECDLASCLVETLSTSQ